jgi:MFS family permease/Ca2+-binding EF-hand superfamily protein
MMTSQLVGDHLLVFALPSPSPPSMGSGSGDDDHDASISKLLEKTPFSRRELTEFYAFSHHHHRLSQDEFFVLLRRAGVGGSRTLMLLLWKSFDADRDGSIETEEVILKLAILLRGDLPTLSRFFFDLYDRDGSGLVSKKEIQEVYGELLAGTTDTVMTPELKHKASLFLQLTDVDHDGKITFDEYLAAVEQSRHSTQKKRKGFVFWLVSLYLFTLTTWLDVGAVYAFAVPGALSERLKNRFDLTESGIGLLSGAFWASAILSPAVGGVAMKKYGPAVISVAGNVLVTAGSVAMIFAYSSDNFGLFVAGRFIVGLGGAMLPFSSLETVRRFFPRKFMLMAGWRAMFYSFNLFFAFAVLPFVASSQFGGDLCSRDDRDTLVSTELDECIETEEVGTNLALWIVFVLSCASLLASVLSLVYFLIAKPASRALSIGNGFHRLALAVAPKAPGACKKLALPVSFYVAIFAIRGVYMVPTSFTTFTTILYQNRYGASPEIAAFQTGTMFLIGAFCGPFVGVLSDRIGHRAILLALFMAPAVLGLAILLATTSEFAPWIACVLFGLSYGSAGVIAFATIPLIVGMDRADVAYGIFAVFGNMIAFATPAVGGILFDVGEEALLLFFEILVAIGFLLWIVVRLIESDKSELSLPLNKVVRASEDDIDAASLFNLLELGATKESSTSAASEESSADDSNSV